jgi:hypothetical protein
MTAEFVHEPSFVGEDIERRADVRGPVRDLWCELPDAGRARVLECGRKGVFVELADPDALPLGARLQVAVLGASGRAAMQVEVVRKEIHPRRGIALLIVHLAPAAEATYGGLIGE